jgi:hypothetical protein
VDRVQKNFPAAVNFGLICAGVGLHRWISRSWQLTLPRFVPLLATDAIIAYNVYRLVFPKQSWQELANSVDPASFPTERAKDDEIGSWKRIEKLPDWDPQSQNLTFALRDRPEKRVELEIGKQTPEGLVYGHGGAIDIRRAGCDLMLDLSNGRYFTGCLAELRQKKELRVAPRELVGLATQCVLELFGNRWFQFGSVAHHYIGTILRPSVGTDHSYELHAAATGNTALFVMEQDSDKWVTKRSMVLTNDKSQSTSATYMLKPGDLVCLVGGTAATWVAEKLLKDEAFAPKLTEDGTTATDVRNTLAALHPDAPLIVFKVPTKFGQI